MEASSHKKCETDWKLAGDCKPTLDPIVPACSIIPAVCSGLHEFSRNRRSTLHPRAKRPHGPVDAAAGDCGKPRLADSGVSLAIDINISASIFDLF